MYRSPSSSSSSLKALDQFVSITPPRIIFPFSVSTEAKKGNFFERLKKEQKLSPLTHQRRGRPETNQNPNKASRRIMWRRLASSQLKALSALRSAPKPHRLPAATASSSSAALRPSATVFSRYFSSESGIF